MTTQPQWSSLDDPTADLLSTLAADWRPFVVEDMNLVARAIRDDADGRVKPQRVGITYRSLRLSGQIVPDGYGTNDDASGNAGKPQIRYRWVGAS